MATNSAIKMAKNFCLGLINYDNKIDKFIFSLPINSLRGDKAPLSVWS